jgi:hypothetical protein
MPKPVTQNTLFYGDNLPKYVIRQTFKQAEKIKRKQGKFGNII